MEGKGPGLVDIATVRERLAGHIAGLDGLRAIAVLWVIWHNVFGDFPLDGVLSKLIALFTNMGWMGVQLFFVISGFLITGILLQLRERAWSFTDKFRVFYWRRSLRIFPLYYFALFLCLLLLPWLGVSHDGLEAARGNQWWFWTYTINWVQPFYPPDGLSHFWSLAIEEQFYLIWPFIVLSVSRVLLVRVCLLLVLSAIIFRLALMLWFPALYEGGAAYMFTIARWDALAIGALLAIGVRNDRWLAGLWHWHAQWVGGTLMVIAAVLLFTNNFNSTPVGAGVLNQTIAAVLFAGVIFYVLAHGRSSRLLRMLDHPVLISIGKYSYALYVFHIPVRHVWRAYFSLDPGAFEGWRLLLAGGYNVVGVFALTYLAALLSWRVLEQPALRLKGRVSVQSADTKAAAT